MQSHFIIIHLVKVSNTFNKYTIFIALPKIELNHNSEQKKIVIITEMWKTFKMLCLRFYNFIKVWSIFGNYSQKNPLSLALGTYSKIERGRGRLYQNLLLSLLFE